jgi:hypothetical protein
MHLGLCPGLLYSKNIVPSRILLIALGYHPLTLNKNLVFYTTRLIHFYRNRTIFFDFRSPHFVFVLTVDTLNLLLSKLQYNH